MASPASHWRSRPAFLALVLMLALAGACGRKTDPRPPEFLAPAAITDLVAEQTAAGVVLSWKRPERFVDGERMINLGGFRIERSQDEGPFEFLTALSVNDRDRIRQIRRFRYVDANILIGHTYLYRVFASTLDEYMSGPSNVAYIVAAEVTPIPSTPTPTVSILAP